MIEKISKDRQTDGRRQAEDFIRFLSHEYSEMSKNSVEFTPGAAKQLRKLAHDVQARIAKAIDKLSQNPFPPGFKKLSGQKDLYRIRVGDYRIIYQFNAGRLVILILRLACISHRPS